MNALWSALNAHAGWVFLLGVAGVVLWHGLRRHDDRALALRLRAEKPEQVELVPGPEVSALVAAWNEAEMIDQHIASFLRLGYPYRELILCVGGDDGSYETARQHGGGQVVVLEQHSGEGKQRALQRCLDHASGQVIFLTDADCLLDDDSFARTLAPLWLQDESVTTGTSRPLRRQLRNPFVLHQWCTNLFADARRSQYVSGILGRNCALTREALEHIGGFAAQVRTGTDYYAAKLLLQQGHRLCYVRDSAVETRYPETLRSYWQRQSRWVRNLMVHGPAFGAWGELAQAVRTSLVGWTMLLLPLVSLVAGAIALAVWGVLLIHTFLAKVRYAHFARWYQGIEIRGRQYAVTPVYMLADFIAWALPLFDVLRRRHQW